MGMDDPESPNEWAPFCRACLVTSNLRSVLNDDELRIKFKEITSIQINEEDELIALLCEDCIDVLCSAHQFRKQCLSIDDQIRAQLLKINNESSPENADDDANIILKKHINHNSLSDELPNDNDTDEDDLYVIVVNEEDKAATDNDSLANNESESENGSNKNSKCLLPHQIKVESHEETETSKNNDMDIEIYNNDKPEFIKLEYNFSNSSTNSTHSDNIHVIRLFKDSVNDSNIVKLEAPHVSNDASAEDNVTYTQEEIVVSNGEDAYEIINCDISELNMENLENIDQRAIWRQDDGTFLCECGEVYTDLSEYEKHFATHNNHTCHICGKNVESKEVLKNHLMLHEEEDEIVPCSYCLKKIKRSMLSVHISVNHIQHRPTCTICKRTFATEHNRKRHMATHFDSKHHECDICHVIFYQKKTFDNHKMLHENLEYLNCSSCMMVYLPEEAHLHETCDSSIFEEDLEPKKLSCNKCECTFDNMLLLRNHIELVHAQQSNLLCPSCGLVFPNKKTLFGHYCSNRQNKPRNVRRFSCGECGKGCPSQAMLTMHERVHTNERPFKCKKCILAFKTKTHLTTHQLTHTHEKKFSCSVCPKAFSLKGNLVVHMRTHTGERPYACNICSQAFIDSKYLKKHKLRRHTAEESMW